MTQTIQAIRGMNDVLPDEAPLWEFFEDTVRGWLAQYGYRNIRMPIVERTELFVRSIGEATDIVEKEMYTFVDQLNGESLTLRPGRHGVLRARGDRAQPALQRPAAAVVHGADVPARAAAERPLSAVSPVRRRSAGFPGTGHRRRAHRHVRAAVADARPRRRRARDQYARQCRDARALSRAAGRISRAASRRARRGRAPAAAHQSAARARQQESGDAGPHRSGARSLSTISTRPRAAFRSPAGPAASNAGIAFAINPRLVRGLDYYNDAFSNG